MPWAPLLIYRLKVLESQIPGGDRREKRIAPDREGPRRSQDLGQGLNKLVDPLQ